MIAQDILLFLSGAAVGSIVTFLLVRPKPGPVLDMADRMLRGDLPVRSPDGVSGWVREVTRTLERVSDDVAKAKAAGGAPSDGAAHKAALAAAEAEAADARRQLTAARKDAEEARHALQQAQQDSEGRPAPAAARSATPPTGDGEGKLPLAAVETVSTNLLSSISSQEAVVEETAAAVAQMVESLRRMDASVEVLVKAAEESSSTIVQISATNNEVVDNIHHLATAVEETAASIEEMTYSIKEVAKNIEDLSLAAEQTSASMNEMDTSISQVESNANATARLSEEVSRDAEKGSDAVLRTIDGIDKIRDSTRLAASVIKSLGNRIQEIGNILNVIDDVAEQTNLLALNAAIIAAQSGEHGRGFAVVADEIKDLAERTAASTKEIAALIKSVQDESRNAVDSIQEGERNVEAGVALSREADGALKKILESALKSTQMVKAIAQATVEQAKGSKVVADAVERIAKTVQQVAAATAEQARGSEQIMKSAERMKTITQHVERSTQEQAKGSKQVTRAIESIHEMVGQIHRSHREQQQVAEATLQSARTWREGLVGLSRAAEQIRARVRDGAAL